MRRAVEMGDSATWARVGIFTGRTPEHDYFDLREPGVVYPGPSRIFEAVGLVDYRAPWFTPTARELGKALHAAIAWYLKGTLDWSTLDERIRDDVAEFAVFVRDTGFQPILWERMEVSHFLGFGGTFDLFGVMPKGPTPYAVIDTKRRTVGEVTRLQLAAYQGLLSVATGMSERLIGRYGWTIRNGKAKLIAYPHTDRGDLNTIIGLASGVNWARRYGVAFNRREVGV